MASARTTAAASSMRSLCSAGTRAPLGAAAGSSDRRARGVGIRVASTFVTGGPTITHRPGARFSGHADDIPIDRRAPARLRRARLRRRPRRSRPRSSSPCRSGGRCCSRARPASARRSSPRCSRRPSARASSASSATRASTSTPPSTSGTTRARCSRSGCSRRAASSTPHASTTSSGRSSSSSGRCSRRSRRTTASAPVLLIDEIDRADEEFEAFLLEILSDFAITIPELGTVRAAEPPRVVLTSNRTREVHDALKRRCLYHWIDYPTAQREYEIVLARVPDTPERLATRDRRVRPAPARGGADEGAGRRRDARLGVPRSSRSGRPASRRSSSTRRSASCSSTRRTCAPSGARPPAGCSRRRRPRPPEPALLRASDPPRAVSGSDFFWNALLFTRALRAAGVQTDLGAAIDYSRALTLIDIGDRDEVHAAGQTLFVRRRDEVASLRRGVPPLLGALRARDRRRRSSPRLRSGSRPRRPCRGGAARSRPLDDARGGRRCARQRPGRGRGRRGPTDRPRERRPGVVERARAAPPQAVRPDEPRRAPRCRTPRGRAAAAPRAAPDAPLGAAPPRPQPRAPPDAATQPPDRRRPRRVGLAATGDTAALDGRHLRHQRLDGAPLAPAHALPHGARPRRERPRRSVRLRHAAHARHARARRARPGRRARARVGDRRRLVGRHAHRRVAADVQRAVGATGPALERRSSWSCRTAGTAAIRRSSAHEMARLQRSCHRLDLARPARRHATTTSRSPAAWRPPTRSSTTSSRSTTSRASSDSASCSRRWPSIAARARTGAAGRASTPARSRRWRSIARAARP